MTDVEIASPTEEKGSAVQKKLIGLFADAPTSLFPVSASWTFHPESSLEEDPLKERPSDHSPDVLLTSLSMEALSISQMKRRRNGERTLLCLLEFQKN